MHDRHRPLTEREPQRLVVALRYVDDREDGPAVRAHFADLECGHTLRIGAREFKVLHGCGTWARTWCATCAAPQAGL